MRVDVSCLRNHLPLDCLPRVGDIEERERESRLAADYRTLLERNKDERRAAVELIPVSGCVSLSLLSNSGISQSVQSFGKEKEREKDVCR